MRKKFKKILVTGGAGFIGSHVVDELVKSGYKVRILDSLCYPSHDGKLPFWINKKAEFIHGDVTKKKDWVRALDGVEAIIHLAAYMDYHKNFSGYVRTNIESIALMFEVILENNIKIKKIISASSQSVYGEGKYKCIKHGEFYGVKRSEDQLRKHIWEQLCPRCDRVSLPVIEEEEDDNLNPLSPYGISKLSSELMLKNLGHEYNVPVVLLRFSIVLGARQSYRHFYSGALRSFTVNVLSNDPIQLNEDGKQIRDFVHVRDVALVHIFVLEDNRTNFESYNVGRGKSTSVLELAKMVAKVGMVDFNPLLNNRFRVGSTRHSMMSIAKLRKLGWKPKYSIEDAVKEYYKWIRQFKDLDKILTSNELQMKNSGIIKNY
ncbi:MAG: NAD-dependent epimerase/dehydratase family protein [Minisyncoccia bacterium]